MTLYKYLRVFEQELTSISKSSVSAQNIAFVSHSKSSTNKVKSGHIGAYSTYAPSTSLNNIPEREVPAGFADEWTLKEHGHNWHIARLLLKERVLQETEGESGLMETNLLVLEKEALNVSNVTTLKEQYQNCLLTMDDGIVNWGEHTEEEVETNHALMAISSNNEDHPLKNKKDKKDIMLVQVYVDDIIFGTTRKS
ncbi:hypothetical protein Tco_0077591 [Tanacetum coccineum]